MAAVREQQAGALGVDGDRVVEVEARTLERGEVHDVGEVVGDAVEVACREITDAGRDAERVAPRPGSPASENRAIPQTSLSAAR